MPTLIGIFLLSYLDSNQERQNQNLQCYHYTIAQYYVLKRSAKVKYNFYIAKFFLKIFLSARFLRIFYPFVGDFVCF